ncbi:MAG: WG repeat-containing protein [Treponema sp.]|nr:WG repeat-containing protein [Treponema sp.]
MKKSIILSVFILILLFIFSCKRSVPDNVTANSMSILPDIQIEETNIQFIVNDTKFINENDIVWIVEPVFDYNDVYYCDICGYTANSYTYILNRLTGQIAAYHGGHGGSYLLEFLYDSENKMFGERIFGWDEEVEIYSIDQFSEHFPMHENILNYVRQFDFTKIIISESEWGEKIYNFGEKYANSKYAIALGSTLLTDFIFDRPDNLSTILRYENAIPVSKDGKWGFIDKWGNIAVPLIFDHIASYDGDTAFMKINGKYGIIDVLGTASF